MSTVASPCISLCRMDPASGLCEGCLRTLDEIVAWGMLDDAGKRDVWALIRQRALSREPGKPGESGESTEHQP